MPCERGRWSAQDIREGMRLYAVTDRAWLDGRRLEDMAAEAIAGGATFIQLREKHAPKERIVQLARALMPICRAAGVPFVIDDEVEIARQVGADGVHVGQSDTACAQARRVLGEGAIIGVSAQTVEQALAAQAAGADYLGVGALIPTPTKPDAVDVTASELARICAAVDIPVVGIGGLNQETLDVLRGTGAAGAAVVSALFAAQDPYRAARILRLRLDDVLARNAADKVAAPWPIPAVLSCAGSDSSGGAGIQADIKTIAAHGLFAETAITALTAQNTCGVLGVTACEPAFVQAQIDAVFQDIPPAAVKVGMVSSAAIARAIAQSLASWGAQNVVVDPVMVATSGASLLDPDAQQALVEELLPLATVITPNMPEAQALLGRQVSTPQDQQLAAVELAQQLGCAVLVKGGHGSNDANDVLARPQEGYSPRWFNGTRIQTANTHGTGCTLSSAIACGLAQGLELEDAIASAKMYLTGALAAGLDLGQGSGPVDHMWRHRPNLR